MGTPLLLVSTKREEGTRKRKPSQGGITHGGEQPNGRGQGSAQDRHQALRELSIGT
jgi:hypothetical protein